MNAHLYLQRLQRLIPAIGMLGNAVRFPGLRSGLRVEIAGRGRMAYGRNVTLGEGTRIELSEGGSLDIANDVAISRGVHINVGPGRRTCIGAHTTIQDNCRIYGDVSIGRYCILAPNVFVSSGTHTFDAIPHRTIQEQEGLAPSPDLPVRIFDDCWLGINAVVIRGVTIGRGCVVGANTVVPLALPPYSVTGGNPARVLRVRLAFVPKSRIEAGCEEDLPYFYDGFNSVSATKQEDIVADCEFVLALNRPNAQSVRLCLSGERSEIAFGGQVQPVPLQPNVVEFRLGANTASLPFLTFHVVGRCHVLWAELI